MRKMKNEGAHRVGVRKVVAHKMELDQFNVFFQSERAMTETDQMLAFRARLWLYTP